MPTHASTLAPPRGRRLRAALRRSIFLAALTLLAVAPDAAALPPDDDPLPPIVIGIWLDDGSEEGSGASAGERAGGYQVCWRLSPEKSNAVRVEPQGGGVLVYFPFPGPLAPMDEVKVGLVPEGESFSRVAGAGRQIGSGTQEAGAARYC